MSKCELDFAHDQPCGLWQPVTRVSSKIQERRMRLAGHIHRHEDLVAQELLLWEPTQGVRGRGRPALTIVDTLKSDTELDSTVDIGTLMGYG